MLELSNKELKTTMIKMLRTLMEEVDNTQMNNVGRKAKSLKRKKVKLLSCVRLFATAWTGL